MEWIFWASLIAVIYTYAGYPLLLSILSFLNKLVAGKPRESKKAPAQPSVSVVLVVHNEEARVLARIENLLQADYPKLEEVLVICDRCDDNTGPVAASATGSVETSGISQWVRVIDLEKGRKGRAAGMNQAVAIAKGDIVVFTDIGYRFERDTVSRLVAPFADKRVGAVTGHAEFKKPRKEIAGQSGVYGELEKLIQEKESDIGSTIGCDGAVYAVRGDAYEAIPEDTASSEFVVAMKIALAGYRVLFVRDARACALQSGGWMAESRRRMVRQAGGEWRTMIHHPRWLLPWENRLVWQLVSHKYLRLLSPGFLLLIMVANLMVVDEHWFYWLAFFGQVFGYIFGMAGLYGMGFPWKAVGLGAGIVADFLRLQLLSMAGLLQWIRGAKPLEGW
jgi:cellulose synthase/poly-beta-1,6-N-acetylglucosamine synthase-like glycosyltransferase